MQLQGTATEIAHEKLDASDHWQKLHGYEIFFRGIDLREDENLLNRSLSRRYFVGVAIPNVFLIFFVVLSASSEEAGESTLALGVPVTFSSS